MPHRLVTRAARHDVPAGQHLLLRLRPGRPQELRLHQQGANGVRGLCVSRVCLRQVNGADCQCHRVSRPAGALPLLVLACGDTPVCEPRRGHSLYNCAHLVRARIVGGRSRLLRYRALAPKRPRKGDSHWRTGRPGWPWNPKPTRPGGSLDAGASSVCMTALCRIHRVFGMDPLLSENPTLFLPSVDPLFFLAIASAVSVTSVGVSPCASLRLY